MPTTPPISSATDASLSPAAVVATQRDFFKLGYTRDVDYRLRRLQDLHRAISEQQDRLFEALARDLGKPRLEAAVAEVDFCLRQIEQAIAQLRRWSRPRRLGLSPLLWPGIGRVSWQPLGVVLIMGAWNYPAQTTLGPLVGAIAAGNCVILKPSEVAPHSARAIADLIRRAFDPMYVAAIEGGVNVSQTLLEERFDHIFYTGGSTVAKVVMAYAAKHLTPVTLELGSQNPCLIDRSANLAIAARRIAWGKFFNAGQSGLAPDYALVPREQSAMFVQLLGEAIGAFFGPTPSTSPDFARIVNHHHLERLTRLQSGSGRVAIGGDHDPANRYFAPTVLENVHWDDPVMQEAIFGPILPVLPYDDLDGAVTRLSGRPRPSVFYLFARDRSVITTLKRETVSNSVCINDVLVQPTVPPLPLEGLGVRGLGGDRGWASFAAFSYPRSLVWRSARPDWPWRYAPHSPQKLTWLDRLLRWPIG
ncbi:MAG: aldehyde dehydrogenase family protein [Oscillatoriales cyanobacterium]|nr:MAG: aldehyde dehydrogenase family protein [Oscillatoriales cyanobacterium]